MIKYDGKDFSDLLEVTGIEWSILPPQTINDQDVPARAGKVFVNKEDDPREIPVNVIVRGKDMEEYDENIRKVAEYLHQEDEKTLQFEDLPDWKIDAIVDDETELDTTLKHGEGTITFYCSNPFYRGKKHDSELRETNEYEHSITSTMAEQDRYKEKNKSTVPTPPFFDVEFLEDADEFQIIHEESGRKLKIEYDFKEDDKLKIDGEKRKIEISGDTKKNELSTGSSWFDLEPKENHFTIEPIGKIEIDIKYRELHP